MVYGWFGAVRCLGIGPFGDAASRPENEKFMTPGALQTLRDMKGVDLPVLQSKFERSLTSRPQRRSTFTCRPMSELDTYARSQDRGSASANGMDPPCSCPHQAA
jgi:hypothetical protein